MLVDLFPLGARGEKYFLFIIDDHSRKIAIYSMTDKSQIFSIFTKHIVRAKLQLDFKLKRISI